MKGKIIMKGNKKDKKNKRIKEKNCIPRAKQ